LSPSLRAIRHTLRLLRPYRALAALILLLLVMQTALAVADPLILRHLIDGLAATTRARFELVVMVGAVFFAVIILRSALEFALGVGYARLGTCLTRDLRSELMASVVRLPYPTFQRYSTGDLMARINDDVAALERFITESLVMVVLDSVLVIVTLGVLLHFNLPLTLLLLVLLPLHPALFRLVRGRVRQAAREQRSRNATHVAWVKDILDGIQVVLAFRAGRAIRERYEEILRHLADTTYRWQVLRSIGPVLAEGASALLRTVVIIGYGGWLVLQGQLTLGSLVAFFLYSERLIAPLVRLFRVNIVLQSSLASFERIWELLPEGSWYEGASILGPRQETATVRHLGGDDAADLASDPPGGHQTVGIQVDRLSFQYETGEVAAVEGVSLVVPAGGQVALVGASGSGKSTLLMLLAGLFESEVGSITYRWPDGTPVSPGKLRLGFVPQETFLFNLTLRENLLLVRPEATEEMLQRAMRLACIDDLPLDESVGNRGERLSGGQRQRVAVARALLYEPHVLLLDEATSALDPELEARLLANLRQLGLTLILATHRIHAVQDFPRLYVFRHGRIVGEGTHEELLAGCEAYRELLGL